MALQWLLRSWLQKKATEKLHEAAKEAMRKSQAKQSQAKGEQAKGEQGGESPSDNKTTSDKTSSNKTSSDDANPQAESPPQPCDVAVLFTLEQEAGGMVDRLQAAVATHAQGFVAQEGGLQGRRVVMAVSGIGQQHAAKVAECLIAGHKPQWVISAGFASGLSDQLKKNDILMADQLVDESGRQLAIDLKMDSQTLARERKLHVGTLLTADNLVESPAAKRTLGKRFDALAVDRETMAVASVCRREKVRFLSVRIISDGVDDRLSDEVRHLRKQESTVGKIGAATGALFRRPSSIKQMWQLKEEALTLSEELSKFLEGVIVQLVSRR